MKSKKMKKETQYLNNEDSALSSENLHNCSMIILIVILALLNVACVIILLFGNSVLKYSYIDFNGNLGLSNICRESQNVKKCNTNDNKIIYVKEFIDNRKCVNE